MELTLQEFEGINEYLQESAIRIAEGFRHDQQKDAARIAELEAELKAIHEALKLPPDRQGSRTRTWSEVGGERLVSVPLRNWKAYHDDVERLAARVAELEKNGSFVAGVEREIAEDALKDRDRLDKLSQQAGVRWESQSGKTTVWVTEMVASLRDAIDGVVDASAEEDLLGVGIAINEDALLNGTMLSSEWAEKQQEVSNAKLGRMIRNLTHRCDLSYHEGANGNHWQATYRSEVGTEENIHSGWRATPEEALSALTELLMEVSAHE